MGRHLDGNIGSALTMDVCGSEGVYLEMKKGMGRDNADMAIWACNDSYMEYEEKKGIHFWQGLTMVVGFGAFKCLHFGHDTNFTLSGYMICCYKLRGVGMTNAAVAALDEISRKRFCGWLHIDFGFRVPAIWGKDRVVTQQRAVPFLFSGGWRLSWL